MHMYVIMFIHVSISFNEFKEQMHLFSRCKAVSYVSSMTVVTQTEDPGSVRKGTRFFPSSELP